MKRRPQPEAEFTRLHAPAGERPGRFLDVGLAVAAVLRAFAEREKLHHLAGEIFVWRLLAAVGAVEINEHRRVFGYGMQQTAEIAQRFAPEQQVLAPHAERAHDLALRRREVVVPEQRHAFGQRCRRVEHFAHPPDLDVEPFTQQLSPLGLPFLGAWQQTRWNRRRLQDKHGRRMQLRRATGLGDDFRNCLPGRLTGQRIDFGLARRKARPPEQMPCLVGRKPLGHRRLAGRHRQ